MYIISHCTTLHKLKIYDVVYTDPDCNGGRLANALYYITIVLLHDGFPNLDGHVSCALNIIVQHLA